MEFHGGAYAGKKHVGGQFKDLHRHISMHEYVQKESDTYEKKDDRVLVGGEARSSSMPLTFALPMLARWRCETV